MTHPILSLVFNSGVVRAPLTDDADASAPPASPPTGTEEVSLKDLITAAQKNQITVPGKTRSAAPIRKLGNDFSRVYPGWNRRAIILETDKFGGEGVYCLSKDVADLFVKAGRHKLMNDAVLYLACDGESTPFLTYAKVAAGEAASSYVDALEAAKSDWTWVQWTGGRNGLYSYGHPPKPKAPPVWPTDRTASQIYDAIMVERLITNPTHWVVERILQGR